MEYIDRMRFNHWLPGFLSAILPGMRVNATVLFGRAYFRQSRTEISDRLYLHEKEHIKQTKRDGMIYFKLRYITEFIVNLFRHRSFIDAYMNISYEKEAREAERIKSR